MGGLYDLYDFDPSVDGLVSHIMDKLDIETLWMTLLNTNLSALGLGDQRSIFVAPLRCLKPKRSV